MNWEYWMGIPADGVPLDSEACWERAREHDAGMTTFSGDMNIGWGFGLAEDEPLPPFQLTDPLLAVSELEQKVNDLEERLQHWAPRVDISILEYDIAELCQRITDLEERLRNATIVISGQVDSIELLFEQQNSQNERLNVVEELLSTWTTR